MTTYTVFPTTLYVKHQILLEAKRLSVPCLDVNLSITVSLRKLN